MSRGNPRKAMAALLPLPLKAGENECTVRPMTLGMFAALERIASPLVTGEDAANVMDLLPSLYLLTHDPREVFKGNLVELAMEWADKQPITVIETIKSAAYRQMNAAFDVIPQADPKKKPAATTDGSPDSSTGPQRPTTGALKKSCGASRSRQSRSSGEAKALKSTKSTRSPKSKN